MNDDARKLTAAMQQHNIAERYQSQLLSDLMARRQVVILVDDSDVGPVPNSDRSGSSSTVHTGSTHAAGGAPASDRNDERVAEGRSNRPMESASSGSPNSQRLPFPGPPTAQTENVGGSGRNRHRMRTLLQNIRRSFRTVGGHGSTPPARSPSPAIQPVLPPPQRSESAPPAIMTQQPSASESNEDVTILIQQSNRLYSLLNNTDIRTPQRQVAEAAPDVVGSRTRKQIVEVASDVVGSCNMYGLKICFLRGGEKDGIRNRHDANTVLDARETGTRTNHDGVSLARRLDTMIAAHEADYAPQEKDGTAYIAPLLLMVPIGDIPVDVSLTDEQQDAQRRAWIDGVCTSLEQIAKKRVRQKARKQIHPNVSRKSPARPATSHHIKVLMTSESPDVELRQRLNDLAKQHSNVVIVEQFTTEQIVAKSRSERAFSFGDYVAEAIVRRGGNAAPAATSDRLRLRREHAPGPSSSSGASSSSP